MELKHVGAVALIAVGAVAAWKFLFGTVWPGVPGASQIAGVL